MKERRSNGSSFLVIGNILVLELKILAFLRKFCVLRMLLCGAGETSLSTDVII